MNKVLVGIPVISGVEHCKLAIESVENEADVLVIDNGSEDAVRELIFDMPILVINNTRNMYVNFAWNQILHFFLQSKHETLVIMNSDLIMKPEWSQKLIDGTICIPTDGSHTENVVVTEGTPGVFIHLNKEMAKIIYPIPDYIKLWFGDNWIFEILRRLGYQTVVTAGLICEHYNGGSQSVNVVPDKEEIIEEDKRQWALHGERDMQGIVIINQTWK